MKSHTLILLFLATLSCRAQNSTANSTARPVQGVESAKPAQDAGTPAQATDAGARAELADAASNQSASMKPIMAAMVVDASADMKPTAQDLKKDLADLRAEQRASMVQQLADEAQNHKTAFVGILAIEQPMFSLPTPSNGAAPVVALAPAMEKKNVAAAYRSK